MNIPLFVFLLFSLQLVYWWIANRSSKEVGDAQDYFLAGKTVGLFPLTMTFLATQVGGGIVLGTANEAYLFGWPVLFYPLGVSFGLIVLGLGLGKKLAEFKVTTVAEIFEVAYGSITLKKAASLLSIISLFMILVGQIIASSKFMVSLGLDNTFLFIAFWAVVIIYTAQGGLKGVISTDMVQAGFFSLTFLLSFGYVFFFGGVEVPMETLTLESFFEVSPKAASWLLMPLLFMLIEQDMGQRCFAGSSGKVVSKAALLAGIGTLIVCLVPIFFGVWAGASKLEIPQGGSVLMTAIASSSNAFITAVVGCAVLAAVISTATSLINAISSNLASDFISQKNQKQESIGKIKLLTVGISILAIGFASCFDNIVDVLIQSYELSVSALFVPIAFALFQKRGSKSAAYLSFAFGSIGFVAFRLFPIEFPREIASLGLALLGFGTAELFTLILKKQKLYFLRG